MEYQRHMEPSHQGQGQGQGQWGYGWGTPAAPPNTHRNKRPHSESEDDAFSEESSKDATYVDDRSQITLTYNKFITRTVQRRSRYDRRGSTYDVCISIGRRYSWN